MEDEICPYATFHLLGFREEMDPAKAGLNFQTFPHGNGMPHAGTMGPPHHNSHNIHSRSGSQSMPRQNNRYARKNSQGGNSSIYTPAPEYDDPANCAEEDQYRNRYSRPAYGRAGGPEYDDPASCAPEDDQYTGQYGTPYEHYGSRPSFAGSGRNLSASPEPPPPPPRNQHPTPNGGDPNGSSFNDSKDSNEISEAECDQPRALSVRAHNTKDGMTTEEMRKLIERNEATNPHQQFQSSGGLTTYDTVAV